MDVSEIMQEIPKRKQDDDNETKEKAVEIKKPKFDRQILELIEKADDEDDEDVLDENGLKKLALLFEKRVLNNQKMRLKYPDDPQKFMASLFHTQS